MLELLITIIFVAIILGLDAFSLALGYGIRGISRVNVYRVTVTITLYHILLPLLGLNIGIAAGKLLGLWAARLGAIALAYIGLEMIREGYRAIKKRTVTFAEIRSSLATTAHDLRMKDILLLGFFVSIDALTVGFGLGTLRVSSVLLTCLIIGAVAGVMTLAGFLGGRVFSRIAGSYAQMAGGLVLLALAVKMLIQGGIY